jgi:hypothetical protein
LRATMGARPVGAAPAGKRAAHIRMPATEYSRHEIAYLCHNSPRLKIALVCITRSAAPIWATSKAFLSLFVLLFLPYTYATRGRLTIEQTPH